MNKVILVGRLTRDPEVRHPQNDSQAAVARYTLAVERRFKRENEQNADFIPCVVFGKMAEFTEKYFHQGMRVSVSGHIRTGSYINRENRKVYYTDVVIEEQEFAESKRENDVNRPAPRQQERPGAALDIDENGFMNIPEGIDEELPFS